MSIDDDLKKSMPTWLEGLVPTAEQIYRALSQQRYTYDLGKEFVRAVDNQKYVATASPFRAHRFGPPPEFVKADGSLEFTWVCHCGRKPRCVLGKPTRLEQPWRGKRLPHHAQGYRAWGDREN